MCKYYEVASVRAILKKDSDIELWEARQLMEATLIKEEKIVGFISCGTAMTKKFESKKQDVPGLAMWVIFDWPEYGLAAFEVYLSKVILKTSLEIDSASVVKGRSKSKLFFLLLYFLLIFLCSLRLANSTFTDSTRLLA